MKDKEKKYQNRGKSKDTKQRDRQDKKNSNDSHIPGHNDWKWYAPTETIAKEIASIPFNCITGTPWSNGRTSVNLSRNPSAEGQFQINELSVSETTSAVGNVMTFNYILNYGESGLESTNGINMASKQLYTFVRKGNSGAKIYEAPDLMMYICAMREVYALYFKMKKILGLVKFYSNVNRSVPAVLLRANGLETEAYKDVVANYSIYRGRLNLAAEKINSFVVPKYFKAFMRDAFIQSYVFCDSTSLSGQFYNFNLYAMRQWSATASEEGSSLVPKLIPNTFTGMLDLLNESLNIMFDDTDINSMAGDIDKAFKNVSDALYRVTETTEDYTCVPIYDEDVLNQIENAFYLPLYSSPIVNSTSTVEPVISKSFKVTQGSNNLITHHTIAVADLYNWAPVGSPNTLIAIEKYLFNSHKDKPEYTDVLEWSRLSQVIEFIPDEAGTSLNSINMIGGAELILGSTIYISIGTEDDQVFSDSFAPVGNDRSIMSRQFDWHPTIYGTDYRESSMFMAYGGDVKKCTLVNHDILQRMHDCALYSLFNSHTINLEKAD